MKTLCAVCAGELENEWIAGILYVAPCPVCQQRLYSAAHNHGMVNQAIKTYEEKNAFLRQSQA